MPRLAIAKSFLTGYANLEKSVRKSVDEAIARFEHHTFAGLHLEKLHGALDPHVRTIRIDGGRRGIVLKPDTGDVYCLLAVMEHDAAIKYAKSRKFSVNQRLGVLEVRDATALEQVKPALDALAQTRTEKLFAEYGDGDLINLGLDAEVLPIVRLLTSEDHLVALESMLPQPQYLALVALASGMSPEEAWEEICRLLPDALPPAEVDTDDLVTAMERTPGEVVFVSGPDELAQMLAHPFALWRVFLHPAQRRLARRPSFNGAVQVTGGAGTGKTVTALHRALHLAEKGGSVLMTTYTTTLAESLDRQLDLLIDDAGVRDRITVINIDKLSYRTVKNTSGHNPKIAGRAEIQALWEIAIEQTGAPFSAAFLHREWEQVILAQDLAGRDAYLRSERRGRGRRISPGQKERTWAAISRFLELLSDSGAHTYTQIASEAARILAAEPVPRYQHVIVDEAQDLHPAQWRILRAAVAVGPDDMFIVGDPHQRIYDHRVSLKSLGITVTGRSHKLRQSYRTTAEILNWAVRLLGVEPVAGLDDARDDLTGYRSSLHGRRPVVRGLPDRRAELDALEEQVRAWLDAGVEPHAIGIATRFTSGLTRIEKALSAAGIDTASLAATGSAQDCVRVGTMHRMKGLEFRCVAVTGVDAGAVPASAALTSQDEDPTAHAHDLQRERCLLFVACTRARDALYVSYAGRPSAFLPDHHN
ncbi:UvrD-helicase domain-containing protein [Actinomadura macra]|uniref:UvrD-helicase domain-containing protein n=1 Tax=Actinomadura macra TaxID=46164 RepID=UPI00083315B4|nr:UvrD-helicase domain-containing protein [Actinomadura macra]